MKKFFFDSNDQNRVFFFLDCQVNLYGSILFECCLDKPGILDIDVQFKDTSYDESLRQILEILKKSGLCK